MRASVSRIVMKALPIVARRVDPLFTNSPNGYPSTLKSTYPVQKWSV